MLICFISITYYLVLFCCWWCLFFIVIALQDEARRKRLEREKAAREARNADSLRSPIVCIMGHVDTGIIVYCSTVNVPYYTFPFLPHGTPETILKGQSFDPQLRNKCLIWCCIERVIWFDLIGPRFGRNHLMSRREFSENGLGDCRIHGRYRRCPCHAMAHADTNMDTWSERSV